MTNNERKYNKCGLINKESREVGSPTFRNDTCLGYSSGNDDEPIDKCKNCEALQECEVNNA